MRLVGIILTSFLVPGFLAAQSMRPLPKAIDDQNSHNFFFDLDKVLKGEAPQLNVVKDFIAQSKSSSDLKTYWEGLFKDYIASAQEFVEKRGMKIHFSDDMPAFSKAMALRKLHVQLRALTPVPNSDTDIYIFPSAQTNADLDKAFGAGTAEKLGLTKDRIVGSYDRLFKFSKEVDFWNVKLERRNNGSPPRTRSIEVTFKDGTKDEFRIPDELFNSDQALAYEIFRDRDAIFLPGAPLRSSEIAARRAIVSLADGSFEFRDALGAVNGETKMIFVDTAEAAFEAFKATEDKDQPKKGAFKSDDGILDFVVPNLQPKVCSAHA